RRARRHAYHTRVTAHRTSALLGPGPGPAAVSEAGDPLVIASPRAPRDLARLERATPPRPATFSPRAVVTQSPGLRCLRSNSPPSVSHATCDSRTAGRTSWPWR